MEVVTILSLLVFSIALPTFDVSSDISLVVKLYRAGLYCANETHPQFDECYKDPEAYCSRPGTYKFRTMCGLSPSYRLMAIGMLTPFLLNYFVCFITFLRKETNKKITFIFALLNIYPQFGM